MSMECWVKKGGVGLVSTKEGPHPHPAPISVTMFLSCGDDAPLATFTHAVLI